MSTVKVVAVSSRSIVAKPNTRSQVAVNQSNLVRQISLLGDLVNVDTTGAIDGSMLIYNATEEKFLASTLLDKQTVNGGHF
jgi:hypothetical protein